jgi:hypothetical protein
VRKTTINSLVLAVSLLCLLVLGACPPPVDPDTGTKVSGEETGEIIIKNIPPKMKEEGPDSFKIYVQLSENMDEDKPHAAISSGKIADCKQPNGDVVLKLYTKKEMTTPWKGKGSYYIAVTISPEIAPSWEDIRVKVPSILKKVFSSEANTIDWDSSTDLNTLGNLGKPRIKAIYDLIIKEDTDITTTP